MRSCQVSSSTRINSYASPRSEVRLEDQRQRSSRPTIEQQLSPRIGLRTRSRSGTRLFTKLIAASATLLSVSQNGLLSAFQHIPKFYAQPKEVLGRRVYQHLSAVFPGKPKLLDKSLNPHIKEKIKKGTTNLQLMRKGNAPVGPDGKQVELHHMLQEEPGPMAEVVSTLHHDHHATLHGLKSKSFRRNSKLKKQYNTYRKAYWTQRAQDFSNVPNQ